MKASPILTSFNGGEFSPLMAGRVDLKNYANGCRRIRNFIPTRQGPARRRPGTRFVAEVKTSGERTWLGRFEFNTEQAYVLEFGHLYIRFFSLHGVVGAPFEVVTPYTTSDLTRSDGTFALRFVQSGDVMYICHRSYRQRKLTRTGASTFSIAEHLPSGGPFKDTDPDNLITVYASANTGAGITLTASSAIFLAGHVGSYFLMEQKNVDAILQWEPAKVIVANDVRRSDGKNYHALNGATTGTVKPVHAVGAKYDGNAGVQWQFDDPGFGWAKITAIGGGGTTATADVVSRIPDGAVGVGNPTTRWAHSAWSTVEGFPDSLTFFKERLCYARGRQVWGSVAGDFEDFRDRDEGGLITTDMAFRYDTTSDRANEIQWIAPSDTALLIGTGGDEHALYNVVSTEPFGPGNAAINKQSEYGSRHVPVIKVADGIFFAQKAGRKIRDMRLAESVNVKWSATDVTILAEHVTKSGIIDMAYQQEPDYNLWAVRGDGMLLGFTYDREQEVKGWHPHRIGGWADAGRSRFAVVESVTTIPAPDADRDEVWIIVRRVIDGVTKRYVEWIEYHHEKDDDPEDAFYVDSGLTLDNVRNATLTPGVGATVKGTSDVTFTAGSAIFIAGDVGKFIHYRYSTVDVKGDVTWLKGIAQITVRDSTTVVRCVINSAFPDLALIPANGWRLTATVISGLGHLEGETVDILADGATDPPQEVVAGQITLSVPASKAHIGISCPAVLQPMPIEAGAADGTAQGKTVRPTNITIRFDQTGGALYGRDEDKQLDRIPMRGPSDPMDEAVKLFTGDKFLPWPDGYDGKGLITIIQDQPLPCTVVAAMPRIVTQDAR